MSKKVRSLLIVLFAGAVLTTAAAWQGSRPKSEPTPELLPVLRADSPRWWKGNLHTHSLWSDGDDFPEMVADWYKRHDYNFLALTDHNVLSDGERWADATPGKGSRDEALKKYVARFGESWVERRTRDGKERVRLKPLAEFRSLLEEPGRFLLVPAEEITGRFAKSPVHLNAINLRDPIKPVEGDGVAETIRVNHRAVADQAKRTGWRTVVSLNHPNFGWGVRAEDLASLEELHFFEIFNGHPSVRNYGDDTHAPCERIWDIVLALRLAKHHLPIVYGLATDDAHGYHVYGVGKVNPGRGWVMIRAPHLTAEAVLRSLGAGDFYATTGVTLRDVRREDGRLVVSIRGETGVTYRTQFIATMRDTPLTSEPKLDAKGEPLPVTRIYSAEVGKVVSETTGTEASYRLTGKELYVRAKIISSKPHPNPYQKGDVEVAWVQPIVP
jgi:hypothetical protein